ncbi:MAG: hypothetical protein EOP51_00150 [Sphingobacteriales bacterium]|nr:MAG: hypothetical protein EOP51_00150 [Sphingobacteriales bacterium]
MKYKNYKSAIHNFADSFQSFGYLKTGKPVFNVLLHLKNIGLQPVASFDFLERTITPTEALTPSCKIMFQDYLDWLPDHCMTHKCDIDKLEKLQITVGVDFELAVPVKYKRQCVVKIWSKTYWKADGRDENDIFIEVEEVMDKKFLEKGVPEF